MKKIIISFMLSFILIPISFWASNKNLDWKALDTLTPTTLGWINKQIKENLNKKLDGIKIHETDNWLVQAFCDSYHLNDEGVITYLTPFENQKVIQTYLNNYWTHILKESWLSSKIISDPKSWSYVNTLKVQAWTEKDWKTLKYIDNPYFWLDPSAAYVLAERECLSFRAEHPTNSEQIDNIYAQVHFYATYYKTYHDDLTKWIIPTFVISLIEWINWLIFWAIAMSVFNIIFRTIVFIVGDERKYTENQKKLFNSFWYFILIFLIKIWIIWSLITFIWYDWLNIFKTFFFY